MNNTTWTSAELITLRKALSSKKDKETMLSWAKRLAPKFPGRSVHSLRIKAKSLVESGDFSDVPPNILILDIETIFMEVEVWGLLYNNYINPTNIIKDWSIICWSAKWLFGSQVYGEKVTPKEALNRQDASIMEGLWNLINEADIVITQNGEKFDMPKINTRFLYNGYPPPMYYKQIDLKKVMKKHFAFSSNKLDYVSEYLGFEGKTDMVYQDWKNCLNPDKAEKALEKMLSYNKDDILRTEEVYVTLRPWIAGHPNLNLFSVGKTNVCPNCGTREIVWNGTYSTGVGKYKAFRCGRCGAIGRSTQKKYLINKAEVQS